MKITVEVTRTGTFAQYAAGLKSRIEKGLTTIGPQVQQHGVQNMSGPLQKYGGAITVRGPTSNSEGLSVDVGAFTKDKTTEILWAHELGSGIHGTLYNQQPYPIIAKNKPELVFLWPNPPWGYVLPRIKQIQMAGGPLVFLPWVMHPGVRPQYFLTRALRDSAEQFKTMVIEAIKS